MEGFIHNYYPKISQEKIMMVSSFDKQREIVKRHFLFSTFWGTARDTFKFYFRMSPISFEELPIKTITTNVKNAKIVLSTLLINKSTTYTLSSFC